MKFQIRRVAALAAVALTATFALTACGDDDGGGSGGGGNGEATINFLPKNLGNPYFETSDAGGGKKAVDEFGGAYKEIGPDTATPDAQVPRMSATGNRVSERTSFYAAGE